MEDELNARFDRRWLFAVFGTLLAFGSSVAWSQNVKVTPLGSHTGELCDRDRATIFEDPTGVRILYDAGHSVTGSGDPRLGTVDVVLLSHAHGDTGIHADMKTIVHDFHKAKLMVLNLGPNAVSPDAAAYIVNELIQPTTVVTSHPNEAVTENGKLLPNSRMKAFIDLVKDRPVYLALSGRTMEFDASAKCVAGC